MRGLLGKREASESNRVLSGLLFLDNHGQPCRKVSSFHCGDAYEYLATMALGVNP